MISKEEAVLLLAMRPSLDVEGGHELARLSATLNWDRFAMLVRSAGAIGRVHELFTEHKISIPTQLARGWIAFALATERDNLARLECLRWLQHQCANNGIDLVPIKGMSLLLSHVYPDPSVRSTCDIDVVTLPHQVHAVEKLLLEAGYVAAAQQEMFIRHHHHRVYFRPEDPATTHVEVHWTFLYKTFSNERHDQEIMARATEQGHPFPKLEFTDELISLLLHLAQHRYRGQLKWVRDIAWMLCQPAFDERTLYHRAKHMEVLSAVQYGIWLTRELLASPPRPRPTLRIEALSRLNPPLTLLTEPREPSGWRRPFIDVLLHDTIQSGIIRAAYRTTKVLEEKFHVRLPRWMVLNK